MTSTRGGSGPAARTAEEAAAASTAPALRILLVEDDGADADLAARALGAAGLDCVWERVENEAAFTACLDRARYDVVLSDYRLPSFNGLRALQILRERKLDVPFILVSGALGEEAAIESLKLGATDYVLKHRLERLPAVIRRALRDTEERRQRARAEAALRESESRYRTLVETAAELAKDLTGTFDLPSVLARVQERTATAVPCDVVATFFEDSGGNTRMIAQHGLAADLIADARRLAFAPAEPFGGRVARGEMIRVDDAEREHAPGALLFRRFRLRAGLVVPLRSHERHFGGLILANHGPRGFDAEQARLAQAIAHQLAGAFEIADFQREQREEALVASALARVAQELISSIDLPILLDRLCRVTAEVLDADVTYTLMLRDEEGAFVPVAQHGEAPERWEAVRTIRFPLALVEQWRRAADGGDPLIGRSDVSADPLPPELRSADFAESLSVALLRGPDMVGILAAVRRRGSMRFGPRQERIARGIAQLASLALENARLVGELEQASRLKSDFLATMSHELRTPLNVILGYNELLLDEVFGPVTPEQAASLDRVGTSARELLELISATLDISRLETGRAALDLQTIDPAALLRDIEAETRDVLEKPGVESVWRIPHDLPPLYSDAVKLKVLLKNLIANAVKFTDQGSVTVSAAAHDGWLEFSVADTGIGMTPETQAVIFEPFRQGDGSTTRRHGGVGLGLYIVSRLLELLSGRIEVESEPGVGSTFRVWVQLNARRFARTA